MQNYADLITLEMGKPINESIAEINKCIELCEYYFDNRPAATEQMWILVNKSQ